jgi:L-threonylcarbamoyladenylate synthase
MKVLDCNSLIDTKLYDQSEGIDILINDVNVNNKIINPCIRLLNNSGVIVYPTDTIYGLGTNAYDEMAVKKLPGLKNRSGSMPISVAVANFEMMSELAVTNSLIRKIYNDFLPGGLTLLLDIKPELYDKLSSLLVSETNKIGVRVPAHNLTLALIERFGKPITATSANLHGHPVPLTISEATEQLGTGVDLYLDCGQSRNSDPSTIVEISGKNIKIIRSGTISRSELAAKLEVTIDG